MSVFGALNFFKNYSSVKAGQVAEGAVDLTVWLDQKGATEAAIKQKQEEHETWVSQLIEDENYLDQQQKELDDIELLYKQRVSAAERAKADYTADPNNTEAAEALNELLAGIEGLLPQIAKEKQDVVDAKRIVEETRQASQEVANELAGMRKRVSELEHKIAMNEKDEERAKRERERQENLVGLKTSSNKFNSAMGALEKKAQESKGEADKHRKIAEQLRNTKPKESSAAAKYMNQTPDTSTETLEERMARLLK